MRIAKDIEKELNARMEQWIDQVNDYQDRVRYTPDENLDGMVDDITFMDDFMEV